MSQNLGNDLGGVCFFLLNAEYNFFFEFNAE